MNSPRLHMTEALLNEVVNVIAEKTGNIVGPKQMHMIESRLTKRVLDLGLNDEASYIEHFRRNKEEEFEHLVSLLTVHHTYFFREFNHFEFLGSEALYKIVEAAKKEGRKKIYIWSAACSRGPEVYSLAMYIHHYLKQHSPDMSFEILGTDIDRESVAYASNGVYTWDEVKEIPIHFLTEYWVRGTGDISGFAKVKSVLREKCQFKDANLMDLKNFKVDHKFDIIFCRNVFIYFKPEDIQRIVREFSASLTSSGYLFVGLSESLGRLEEGLQRAGPSIYSRQAPATKIQPKTVVQSHVPETGSVPAPIKVLCVDDSPTILALLKKILVKESGFEVIGTAGNGKEAAEKIKAGLNPDVVTLDIHMPEMTGIEYLERHMNAEHPPVVMLTSASRDNMDLAYKALQLGAKDYIEKPSLNTLSQQADEIRSKLRYAFGLKKAKAAAPSLELERSFKSAMTVSSWNDKVRIVYFDESRVGAVQEMLRSVRSQGPTTVLVVAGDRTQAQRTLATLKEISRIPFESNYSDANKGKVICMGQDDFLKIYFQITKFKHFSYMFFSEISSELWQKFPKASQVQILLDERLKTDIFSKNLAAVTVCPSVSFQYMSDEFFAKMDRKAAA